MKTLIIIRHAKSSWSEQSSVSDHDRRLNERGRQNALQMGLFLCKSKISLGAVFCSTARRAVMTLQRISRNVPLDESDIQFIEELYTFDLNDVLRVIQQWPDSIEIATVVAHNPALTELVCYLSELPLQNLPTTGVVILQLNISSWTAISPSCGRTLAFFYPKMFAEIDQEI